MTYPGDAVSEAKALRPSSIGAGELSKRGATNLYRLLRALPSRSAGATLRQLAYQWGALRDGIRFDLSSTPNVIALGEHQPPGPHDQGKVTVSFSGGLCALVGALPHDPTLRRRSHHYATFLSLLVLLAPRLRGLARLHLTDEHPNEPATAMPQLVFNRRRGASEAFTVMPDVHFVMNHGYQKLRRELRAHGRPWESRRRVAFWRGSSTGGSLGRDQDAGENLRVALCRRSLHSPALLDAKLGRVVNCHPSVEAKLLTEGLLGRFVPPEAQLTARYLVSVDGWAGEWEGLIWKLASGSVVLMVESAWEQWYSTQLVPYRHYVPVKRDLSDLETQIQWCIDHDPQCREIAANAGHLMQHAVTFPQAARFSLAQLAAAATRLTATA